MIFVLLTALRLALSLCTPACRAATLRLPATGGVENQAIKADYQAQRRQAEKWIGIMKRDACTFCLFPTRFRRHAHSYSVRASAATWKAYNVASAHICALLLPRARHVLSPHRAAIITRSSRAISQQARKTSKT